MAAKSMERFGESDEVAGDQSRALVNQLIERVLTVCPGLSPVDGSRLAVHLGSSQRDMLAIAFHRQLLQISGEPLEVLLVRQDCNSLCAEKVVVPDRDQTHQHWQIVIEGSRTKMFIHLAEAAQHLAKPVRADGDHRRKAYRRHHRESPA